ncbi:MAG: beta strand repeat-containing protein [Bacillota bacterium]
MKRSYTILLFFIAGFFSAGNLTAQTITGSTYQFSRSGFAPTDISTGNTQLIGPNSDNVASAVTEIGFDFWFAGQKYTQFSVNENGLLTLGSTQISGNDVNNLMASETTQPKIAPYWDDLATGTNGYVIYKLTGTAPSRVLIVNWYVTVPKNAAGTANATIQLQLSEANGVISFTYGTPAIAANNNQYSIGIGVSSTDFASVTPTSATAATCAYGIAKDNNTISPGVYTRYSFFPDAAAPTITHTALVSTLSTDNRTFTATIGDAKTGVPTTGNYVPRVYYKKNIDGSFVYTQGTLTSGTSASGTWTFTIDNSLIGGVSEHDAIYYFIVAQDQSMTLGKPNILSSPAGVSATDVTNIITPPATLNRYKIGARLSGTVTVGTPNTNPNYPVTNYSSLTNSDGAFEDINIGMLTSDLTIKIVTPLSSETGTNSLNAWANDAGGSFKVKIIPEGNITVTGTTALIKFKGTNGATIDGLNDGTNSLTLTASSGPAVQFSAYAVNNTITKTTLTGGGSAVIYFYDGSGTYTKNCSNNTISNCIIGGSATIHPTAGIYMGSWATASAGTNNVIDNNTIKDFAQNGIHLDRNYSNTTISNNQIYHTFAQSANYIYGIFMDLAVGATNIFNNKIYNLRAGTTNALNSSMIGIFYRSGGGADVLNINNNIISMDAGFTNPAIYNFNAIELGGTGTSNVYYNSIYMGGSGVTSGNSAGLSRTNGTVNFKNNAVYNARSFSSPSQYNKNYAIRSTNLTNFVSDNNLLFANGTSSALGYIGATNGVGGSEYATLSSWSTATGRDLFSFSQDPGYSSLTELTPDAANPSAYVLNGNGAPIVSVSKDISGNLRNTALSAGPTDIGAYEFTPEASAAPISAVQTGTIATGQTTSYYYGGRLIAAISWTGGTALPTIVDLKYWSGNKAPAVPGEKNAVGYWEVSAADGTDFTYDITLYYTPTSIATVTSENNIIITKGNSGVYNAFLVSNANTTNKTVTLSGLNSFSVFALTDRTLYLPAIVKVKVFLEGAFNSGQMNTTINSLIPKNSADVYSEAVFGSKPKTVNSMPADIVDWVVVELRTGTASNTKIEAQAALLKSDGNIVDTDGSSPLTFNSANEGYYYIVVRHRNHLSIMSALPVLLNSTSNLYDFTTDQSKALAIVSGSPSMTALPGGVYGMPSGDADSDGDILYLSDLLGIWISNFGLDGYKPADFNMDGTVDYNNDILLKWFPNMGRSASVR